ncbi:uncharacterized protein [Halyomorpha halys]|uniref:uncharacterized protein n=1 Tax=Halyomorpha halys TaxID=286706 RepID=UPI0006D4CB9C|nr:uncharacterized protein LOC106684960 [Halyomorpha halys]
MLTSFILLQVICCFFANGILNPETIPLPFFSRRTSSSKQNNWTLLLKSATFRTLSKYTNFSPSLDMKMEADTLLWEKLEGAKYIRKGQKRREEPERVKTGLLVDMTRDTGYLEYRQTDNARYNFEPRDNRILALWKVQKLNQNHYLILIKIPQEPPIEDTYEYSSENGLQEIKDVKDHGHNKNKQNKSFSWKSNDSKSARSIEPIDNIQSIKRQDNYVGRTQLANINTYKGTDNYKSKAATQAYIYKPAQYYTIVGFQTPPPPLPKYQTWSQPNDYYSINSYKLFPEFKQNTEYNGFIPSVGPTGSPPLYHSNPLEPITYKQYESYYPTYPSSQIITTQKPVPLTYFKPSAEFIQYSEVDPFYTTEVNTNPVPTVELPTVDPKHPTIMEYQQIVYKSPIPAISIDIPPLNPGESLYDSAINTINNETLIKENAAEPTSTTLIINYPQKSNIFDEKQTISTTELPLTMFEGSNSTTEKINKARGKNIAKSPHVSSLMKTENYDYAPLYIRWGEKIKPQENKDKTTTQKTITDTDKNLNQNKFEEVVPEEINDYAYDNESASDERTEKETEETTTADNEIKDSTDKPDYTTTMEPLELNTTNYVINNITIKSPEEIVSDLTTMGLVNSTIVFADKRNEQFKLDELKNQETPESKKHEDNQEEGSEPVSVVVNRISQSYSYKTSVGHIGNLKQLREIT